MMNPIDLNLASRPIRNNALLWVAHATLAILVVGGTAWNVSAYVQHRRDLRVLNAERDSFESRMSDLDRRQNAARRGIAQYDIKDLDMRASKARDVIQRKALSWTRLFNRMEEVLPYEVKMVSIRPVFRLGRREQAKRESLPEGGIPVSVDGQAKTLSAFFEFERALIFDPHFDNVEPHRFNREANEIVFEMRFVYYPDAKPREESGEAEPAPDEEVVDAVADEAADLAAAVVEQAVPDAVESPDPVGLPETGETTPRVEAEGTPPSAVSNPQNGPRSKARRPARGGRGRTNPRPGSPPVVVPQESGAVEPDGSDPADPAGADVPAEGPAEPTENGSEDRP